MVVRKPFATSEQLLRIAQFGLEEIEWTPESDAEYEIDQESGRREAGFEALRFAVSAAAYQGEARILPYLRKAATLDAEGHCEMESSDGAALGAGISRLLAQLRRVTPEVERLIRSADPEVRSEVAGVLRPETDEARVLLLRLARDDDPNVRNAARQSLGVEHAPPWWYGVFERDPLAGLGEEELLRLRGPLDRTVEMLRVRRHGLKDQMLLDELARTIAELPDELAAQAVACYFRRDDWISKRSRPRELARLLIERDHDAEHTMGLFRQWLCRGSHLILGGRDLQGWMAAGPASSREVLCSKLADLLVASTQRDDDVALRANHGLIDLIGGLWPAEGNPRSLFEAVLDQPWAEALASLSPLPRLEEAPYVLRDRQFTLATLFEKIPIDLTAVFDDVVTIHEAGYPGVWGLLRKAISDRLATIGHPRLRTLAERQLTSERSEDVCWALCYLTGAGNEPECDLPPSELLSRALGEPKLRRAVFETPLLFWRALPLIRAELLAGSLRPEDAGTLVEAMTSLWGSLTAPSNPEMLARKRQEVAALIAPAKLPEAFTGDEWVAAQRTLYQTKEG